MLGEVIAEALLLSLGVCVMFVKVIFLFSYCKAGTRKPLC